MSFPQIPYSGRNREHFVENIEPISLKFEIRRFSWLTNRIPGSLGDRVRKGFQNRACYDSSWSLCRSILIPSHGFAVEATDLVREINDPCRSNTDRGLEFDPALVGDYRTLAQVQL
jgi:hypothetical protein